MMLSTNNMRSSKLLKLTLGLGGLAVLASFASYAKSSPPKSITPEKPTNVAKPLGQSDINKNITNHHQQAKDRMAKLRAKTKAHAENRKAAMAKHKAERQAQTNQDRSRHLEFKTKLLFMLKADSIINSEQKSVHITYSDGDILANTTNLSKRFDTKYNALWESYNHVISNESYILIKPNSYEIREIRPAGQNYHFSMQTR